MGVDSSLDKMVVRKFIVSPRIEIPIIVGESGRYVDDSHRKCFRKYADFAKGYGCYVFSIEYDDGTKIPVYIGQAHKQTLSHESFTTQKRFLLTKALAKVKGGRMFARFIIPAEGKLDKALIDELESDLIQLGFAKNAKLENTSRVRNPIQHAIKRWSIDWESDTGKDLLSVFAIQKES